MSVMNLISKFAVDGLGAGALAMVMPSVCVAVAVLPDVPVAGPRSSPVGAVGDVGCPEHAASIIVRPTVQRI
jgi:hypothetical protein